MAFYIFLRPARNSIFNVSKAYLCVIGVELLSLSTQLILNREATTIKVSGSAETSVSLSQSSYTR